MVLSFRRKKLKCCDLNFFLSSYGKTIKKKKEIHKKKTIVHMGVKLRTWGLQVQHSTHSATVAAVCY